jgi:hypothetical protein
MPGSWLGVSFTSQAYLWVTDHRDEVQENQEAGTLKKWTICLGAELYYAALFVAGLAETAVRAFFSTLTRLIFAIVPISLREKLPKEKGDRIDRTLITLLNTSSYLAAKTTLASLSSLFLNFCVTSVKKREDINKQIRVEANMPQNMKTPLEKPGKIFICDTILNTFIFGGTTTAYSHLTAFRDGKQNDSLLVTLGRRVTAEIGYIALAIVGVVEIVVRAPLAVIAHLLLSFTTEPCIEFMRDKPDEINIREVMELGEAMKRILTSSIYSVVVTTCMSAANVVNNIWSSSLHVQNDLSKQLENDNKGLENYKNYLFPPETEYELV